MLLHKVSKQHTHRQSVQSTYLTSHEHMNDTLWYVINKPQIFGTKPFTKGRFCTDAKRFSHIMLHVTFSHCNNNYPIDTVHQLVNNVRLTDFGYIRV